MRNHPLSYPQVASPSNLFALFTRDTLRPPLLLCSPPLLLQLLPLTFAVVFTTLVVGGALSSPVLLRHFFRFLSLLR
ncbi:hypothetical protein S83_044260 [Arachis hypogaea]